ncbi:MAG: hypothetical protein R6U91_01545 [Bacillota bacterium]
MSKRYKQIILVIVFLAVGLILGISQLDLFTAGEDAPADIDVDQEFTPTEKPYQTYEAAREAKKPIFLEFYASW